MNIGELRKIIYEEVVKAMRAEFREILTEAVTVVEEQKPVQKTPARLSELFPVERKSEPKTIEDILQETARGMNREDYRALMGESQQPQQQSTVPGLPDFLTKAVQNAKNILDASNQKDLERHGL